MMVLRSVVEREFRTLLTYRPLQVLQPQTPTFVRVSVGSLFMFSYDSLKQIHSDLKRKKSLTLFYLKLFCVPPAGDLTAGGGGRDCETRSFPPSPEVSRRSSEGFLQRLTVLGTFGDA